MEDGFEDEKSGWFEDIPCSGRHSCRPLQGDPATIRPCAGVQGSKPADNSFALDTRRQYLIRDHLSFMRFLGLGLVVIPDANLT